ncbi:hypothetical protein EVAR_84661_1 [Eumeta japonica]|uniref:Uncharacterized protein n=1 Tax=Eumeta variegata TaxID=151549 RepID=A0A4C1UZ91_EUMVA|nr:hypothetical protein EVAR_84661_1 [Eumeta japonica]
MSLSKLITIRSSTRAVRVARALLISRKIRAIFSKIVSIVSKVVIIDWNTANGKLTKSHRTRQKIAYDAYGGRRSSIEMAMMVFGASAVMAKFGDGNKV